MRRIDVSEKLYNNKILQWMFSISNITIITTIVILIIITTTITIIVITIVMIIITKSLIMFIPLHQLSGICKHIPKFFLSPSIVSLSATTVIAGAPGRR